MTALMPGCDVQSPQVLATKSTRGGPPDRQLDPLNLLASVRVVAHNCPSLAMGNPQVALTVNGHAIKHNAFLIRRDDL